MAGMALNAISSPKPVSYMHSNPSYNPYQVQRGLSAAGYSDTPPLNLAQPVPQQAGQLFGNGMGMGNGSGSGNGMSADEDGKIYNLVIDLMDPNSREGALLELSKKREQYDELALVLWHSFGKQMILPIIIYVFDATWQVLCQLCCKKSFPFILYYHLQISLLMYLIASVMRSLFCNVLPRTRRLGSCFLTVEFLHTPFIPD